MTNWAAGLQAALRMGISPDAFWRLSVREWLMLTGAVRAMGRGELAALMARFPDETLGKATGKADDPSHCGASVLI